MSLYLLTKMSIVQKNQAPLVDQVGKGHYCEGTMSKKIKLSL